MFKRVKNAVAEAVNNFEGNSSNSGLDLSPKPKQKFPYSRPYFLNLDEDELQITADHRLRPIVHPSDPLPHHAGYAECINGGKSTWNEDQAVYYNGVLTKVGLTDSLKKKRTVTIPFSYYGLFDGHAGVDAALCAANQLHYILTVS